MKEKINKRIYNTETSNMVGILDDNNKRVTIYFYLSRSKTRYIYIRNPYNQKVEIPTDDGGVLKTSIAKTIWPVEEYKLNGFWKNSLLLEVGDK